MQYEQTNIFYVEVTFLFFVDEGREKRTFVALASD